VLDIVKIDKTPLICSVSYFNLGTWSSLLWGLAHRSLPVATETVLSKIIY